jgi:hypothetical protein
MDTHTSCGTTISQVNIVLKRGYRDVLNLLIAVQHFECNMRNLFARPFESLLGFTYDTVDSFCRYNRRRGVGGYRLTPAIRHFYELLIIFKRFSLHFGGQVIL